MMCERSGSETAERRPIPSVGRCPVPPGARHYPWQVLIVSHDRALVSAGKRPIPADGIEEAVR
jgi:hypothetical protein